MKKIKSALSKFSSYFLVSLVLILLTPIAIICLVIYLFYIPVDVIRYHRMPFYKDFGKKYKFFITSRQELKLYNKMKKQNLSVDFVADAEFGYFIINDTVLLRHLSYDNFTEKDGVWLFEEHDDNGEIDQYPIADFMEEEKSELKEEHRGLPIKILVFYDDVTDAETFEKLRASPYFMCFNDEEALIRQIEGNKNIIPEEQLNAMLQIPLLRYGEFPDKNDNGGDTFQRATALYLLTLHEHETGDSRCISHIREHLDSVTVEGNAPCFDAICLWSYCPLSASIALARLTPSVWNSLSDKTKERLSFIMRMFAYLGSFATSDYNNYSTGPGLFGNYHKSWNPNYRLANVTPIIFATCFFGCGNAEAGSRVVNDMLHSFDEAEYKRVIDTLEHFGWNRAKEIWTTPGRFHEDGSRGSSAKDVLVHGGRTYSLDFTHSYVTKDAGDGLGVANGGNDYLYKGLSLSESDKIIENLISYNYSGGEVKSDHHYDINGDGVLERIAWIRDESQSPFQGKPGMMKEFASGNRSSTVYCSHDFILSTVLISAAKTAGIYDIESNDILYNMVKTGNDDFLYKNERGYHCFATGSYGTSAHIHSESNEASTYFAVKALWNNSKIKKNRNEEI